MTEANAGFGLDPATVQLITVLNYFIRSEPIAFGNVIFLLSTIRQELKAGRSWMNYRVICRFF